MADVVDPETLLEWLQMGSGDERDMQLIALEQLCMLLLVSGVTTHEPFLLAYPPGMSSV